MVEDLVEEKTAVAELVDLVEDVERDLVAVRVLLDKVLMVPITLGLVTLVVAVVEPVKIQAQVLWVEMV